MNKLRLSVFIFSVFISMQSSAWVAHGGAGYYHGGGGGYYHSGGYYHGGEYYRGGGYYGSPVIVPGGAWFGSSNTYSTPSCSVVKQCNDGNCVTHEVCY